MKLPTKLGIGCLFALVFIIAFGFIGFPKLLTGKIKQMVNLGPDTEIRKMFVNVPFGIDFNIYIFNVTNPMEIQSGAKPRVQEVGPFCYSEWIKKINVDDEGDDTMSYNPVFTFYKRKGPGCVSGQEVVTIPHPLILGMVNAVVRQKPGALSLVNKAIKSIYQNPTSIFLTASADDILFDGVPINCGVKDFAGKAICSQLKEADSLRHIDDDTLAFALMAPKNGTPGKRFQVLRGTTNFHYVGKILNYDGSPVITTWPNEECNKIDGTDGTIFPPFLTKEEGIASFSPELCRSLKARYVKNTRYNGVPVRLYTADLGDASQNEDEKCFCYTPDTCLKKGLMDLYKCVGVPIYVSMPHFWNCHKSYLKGVDGLKPNKTAHEITILFESMTGGPVAAGRRLQFNMPLWPNEKVDLFKNFTDTVLPMFWVEESIKLNRTMTKPLKRLFTVKRIMNKLKWLVLLSSIGGMGVAFYLHLRGEGKAGVTPIEKVKNEEKGISIVNSNSVNGHDNPAMTTDESDKF